MECYVKSGTQTYGFSSQKKARAFLRRYNAHAKLIGRRLAKLVCER